MPRRHWFAIIWICLRLSACGDPLALTPPNLPTATAQPTTVSAPATATGPPATADMAPAPMSTAAPTALTATPTPAKGTVVLQLAAGRDTGQVGINGSAGPTTFRVAADGSIRVLDAVNKRLLFFAPGSSPTAPPTQTIDLRFLQAPTDFVVTGKGDLYVLDAGGWTVDHLTVHGEELHNIPLNPGLKGAFTTISLTADGRVVGLGQQEGYVLITAQGPLPIEEQPNAKVPGVVTVRSNASFAFAPDSQNPQHQSLLINYGGVAPGSTDLGQVEGTPSFLDINQGMEPYVLLRHDELSEIRRYALEETGALTLAGTISIDQHGCRPALRSLYVDRPGAVYAMCIGERGLTVTRYQMTDEQGAPLPRFEQLVTSAPWSPGNLQAAPG